MKPLSHTSSNTHLNTVSNSPLYPPPVSFMKEGSQGMHTAAIHDMTSLAELFIDRGADINEKNNKGDTPLHAGINFNNINVVEMLLRRGADIMSTKNLGNTPLHESVRSDFCEQPVCQLLLDNGADIFAGNNIGG